MSGNWQKPSSERELCERFAAMARQCGWTVYPEQSGWDLLLVAGERKFDTGFVTEKPHEPGTQVGIQAKLRCNFHVLSQALTSIDWVETSVGPDYRAVLVPDQIDGFSTVAKACGIGVFDLRRIESERRWRGSVSLIGMRPWPYQSRCWLPDFVPDLPAGVPAPVQVTRWKVAALKVCAVLRERGYVTSEDFRDAGITPGVWVDRWIVFSGERIEVPPHRGLRHKYVAKPGAVLPDEGITLPPAADPMTRRAKGVR